MARGPYYEPGRYWGKIVNQQLGKSSNDNPQIAITFTVIGKINPADPEGELLPCGQNHDRTLFRSITPKTVEWACQDLKRLGFTGESFADLDLNSSASCDLRGNEAAFSCVHEEYDGTLREKWQVASDGMTVKPLESAEVRKLDAMFGKYLKKSNGTPKQPTKAPIVGGPLTREARAALDKAKVDTSGNIDAGNAALAEAGVPTDDVPF